ncbi:MAG: hypothetical protein QW260_05650 [Thermoproteota archaeon]
MVEETVLVRWMEMIATTYPGALLRCERPSGEVLFLEVRDASTILVYQGTAVLSSSPLFSRPTAVIRWEDGFPRAYTLTEEGEEKGISLSFLGDIATIQLQQLQQVEKRRIEFSGVSQEQRQHRPWAAQEVRP